MDAGHGANVESLLSFSGERTQNASRLAPTPNREGIGEPKMSKEFTFTGVVAGTRRVSIPTPPPEYKIVSELQIDLPRNGSWASVVTFQVDGEFPIGTPVKIKVKIQ